MGLCYKVIGRLQHAIGRLFLIFVVGRSQEVGFLQTQLILVTTGLATVIFQDDFIAHRLQVVGENGDFAASTRGIDDIGGNPHARGVTAQTAHNFDPLFDGGTKVVGPLDQISLVDVVRFDPDRQKFLHKTLHDQRVVIDPAHKNCLIAKGDAGVGEPGTGLGGCFGDFVGMVEMGIDIEWVIFAQHPHQIGGDALRKDDGNPGADANDLDGGDGA